MKIRLCIWWFFFIPISIMLQAVLPTLDALLIGLIISLQEHRYKDLLWILPLFILIQEGIGSREFGGAILWYSLVIILFIIGRWLFEVQNTLFVLLLSACLGVVHFILVYLLAPLQDLQVVNMDQLIYDNAIQAIFIPIAWWIANFSRRWIYSNADKTKST